MEFPIGKFARVTNTMVRENNTFKMASLTLDGPILRKNYFYFILR
jgi:hypothetical protein